MNFFGGIVQYMQNTRMRGKKNRQRIEKSEKTRKKLVDMA